MTHTCAQCRKEIHGRLVTVTIDSEQVSTTHYQCFTCYAGMVKRPQWRDIETAPKAEGLVLLYERYDDDDGAVHFYDAGEWRGAQKGSPGWRTIWNDELLTQTHWMPLPPPPEVKP